jgi:DNA integrity scanning protein DisA with diadenylate cyclase activity
MATKPQVHPASAASRQLVRVAFELAQSLGVAKVLIQADELDDDGVVGEHRTGEQVIWLTRGPAQSLAARAPGDRVEVIPATPMTRMSLARVGLFLTVLKQHVGLEESVLCLSGIGGSGQLDTLLITSPCREFTWLRQPDLQQLQGVTATREFAQILDIALRFAAQGREGKPIGTIFVLGVLGQVSPFLRQLILNPFEGHSPESRNIHNPGFLETLREFAAMDGAFVVNHKGEVEFGGTYIDAPATEARLREGLGARHAAAAAITAATPAVAVVVSESSGDVTVFHKGQAILELEKPDVIVGTEG